MIVSGPVGGAMSDTKLSAQQRGCIRDAMSGTKLSAELTKFGADLRAHLQRRTPAERGAIFAAMDQERADARIGVLRLCAEAGLSTSGYQKMQRGQRRPSPATLTRLRRALVTLRSGGNADAPDQLRLIQAAFAGCMAAICAVCATDLRRVAALDPRRQRRAPSSRGTDA